jgi:probable phosphoglycerate mutase
VNPDLAAAEGPHLWLVRHGETEWSRSGRHTGLTDVPLTDLGREQAELAGRALEGVRLVRVWSSPLSRALETARIAGAIAGFADRIEVTGDLVEWDYGGDEGRTTAEIREERPGWTIWTHGPLDGEAAEAVEARVDRVIARARREPGDSLVFAHGHVLRVLGARWLGLRAEAGRLLALSTATISILGWERETPVIERWNDPCEEIAAAHERRR